MSVLVQPGEEVVYLIHFDQPYQHARHYLGTTRNLEERLRQHASGMGARLMQVVKQAGITWRLACIWLGGREVERQLKAWHSGVKLCPICKAERVADEMFDLIDEEEEQGLWMS